MNQLIENKSKTRNPNLPPFTLRVKGGSGDKSKESFGAPTDPVGLSQSIIHTMRQNPEGWCDLQTVGKESFWIALKAFRLTSQEIERRTNKVSLANSQWEYTAEINNKPAQGICIHIFPK